MSLSTAMLTREIPSTDSFCLHIHVVADHFIEGTPMKLFDYQADFKFIQDSLIVLTPILVTCVAIGWFFWNQWMTP